MQLKIQNAKLSNWNIVCFIHINIWGGQGIKRTRQGERNGGERKKGVRRERKEKEKEEKDIMFFLTIFKLDVLLARKGVYIFF